tara:strand:- start:1146 stop:2549 length:1404 start_codon:yes stop_codon:yes gene_type:complete
MRIAKRQLRNIIREELRCEPISICFHTKPLSLVETLTLYGAPHYHDGLITDRVLLENYFERPWLLNEETTNRAKLIIEGIWDGLTAAAKFVGGKAVDAGKWAIKTGKKLGGKAAEIVKKLGGKIADVFTFVILKLPKGDVILDFLKNTVASLKEKIKEMGDAIKDKVEEWSKTAKKTIIDFFINTIFPENEALQKDLYKALGVTEEQVEQAANEMRDLGINTITELNWALEINGLICEDVVDKVKEKTGVQDAEDTLKVLGFMDNPPEGKEGNIDPAEFMRGKAGAVVEKMFEIFKKLSDQDFFKYMQPLFDSKFFRPFQTGFGLAAAAFMGILSAGDLGWDKMVEYVQAIQKGFKAGTGKAGKAGRDVRFLFTGDGAGLLKDLVVGLVTGSNIEVIIRALAGDAGQIAEAVKRLVGTIIGGVKQAIKQFGPELVANVAGGDAGEEAEGEVTDALGGFIDDMFPEPA